MLTRRQHLGLGLYYGYPLCCVIRFTLDSRDYPSGLMRGGGHTQDGNYVVCGVFHRTADDGEYEALTGQPMTRNAKRRLRARYRELWASGVRPPITMSDLVEVDTPVPSQQGS